MMPSILLQAGILSAMIMFIIAAAGCFAWMLAVAQVPQTIANWFLVLTDSQYVFIFLVIILVLITGMFLDPTPALIILVPVLLPKVSPVLFITEFMKSV